MPSAVVVAARKRRGGYPTPPALVDELVRHVMPPLVAGQRVTIVDPACGDGRFLVAAARRAEQAGAVPVLTGVDIDTGAVAEARAALAHVPEASVLTADALTMDWANRWFDVVVGNPPYLSQLARATSRRGSSRHGGGPYVDAAVEFLAVAARLARPVGGRFGFVLPQSILASRDAAAVRAELDRCAERRWTWWSPELIFDAQVLVCALVFERRAEGDVGAGGAWTDVITDRLGLPRLPARFESEGTLAQRARLTANFRDQYYGLVPAVGDHPCGPPFVTSGLVDPCRCRWGERSVTFARRTFALPRVDLARLSPVIARWARTLLVPKVVIANQTKVIEAVADRDGAWVPGVPLLTARPIDGADVDAIAAVLTSPVATRWAWHRAAGSGLSARSLRLGPRWLGELPWPAGPLDDAVAAARVGDVSACATAVTAAYGIDGSEATTLMRWWDAQRPTP